MAEMLLCGVQPNFKSGFVFLAVVDQLSGSKKADVLVGFMFPKAFFFFSRKTVCFILRDKRKGMLFLSGHSKYRQKSSEV